MYLMVCTRPDIAYIVGVLSRFVENPSVVHWQGIKRVFRYLKGTENRGISFDIGSDSKQLVMYCDSDWAADVNTRRSTTGWIAFMNGGPIAWSSNRYSDFNYRSRICSFMCSYKSGQTFKKIG